MHRVPAPPPLPPRAVIADDLTGACDTAAQFSRYGLEVAVTGISAPDPDRPVDLLVINTASRGMAAERAREVASRSARNLLRSGRCPVYKKIDSTLKGPWCQELAGIMALTRPDLVIVAPAFPTWGRTTRGGRLVLKDERLTGRGNRLQDPAGIDDADLLGRLRAEFGFQVHLMRPEVIRQPPSAIQEHIDASRRKRHRVLLFDIEKENDLRQLALAGGRLDERVLWVGSAGLARFLPLGWGCAPVPSSPASLPADGPTLLICGSLNPVNRAQLERLGGQGLAAVFTIRDEDAESGRSLEGKQQRALDTLARGESVALCLQPDRRIRSRHHLQGLQRALHSTVRRLLDGGTPGNVVVVGGDTAHQIYEQSGTHAIRIGGEVEPGIPHGRWIGGRLDGLPVVTKAGGFGNRNTLCAIARFLRGELPPGAVV